MNLLKGVFSVFGFSIGKKRKYSTPSLMLDDNFSKGINQHTGYFFSHCGDKCKVIEDGIE